MVVTAEELGRRLRVARQAAGMTQEDVALHLKVSRPTVAQMEAGNRAITSFELDRLAYLFARDIREFLSEEFSEEDTVLALFRRDPDVSGNRAVLESLRECMALGREISNLERLLGIDRDVGSLPSYRVVPPRAKWAAIQQGEHVASEERRRLGVGVSRLPNIAELLEAQGVRTAQVDLPEDVSGLTLVDREAGILVVTNRSHPFLRRRFSYAHEYAHVLLDREQKGAVSRTSRCESPVEICANAFAAAFLMPEEGVREFVRGLAKGSGRTRAEVFDEEEIVSAEMRPVPGSQSIQLYDVVLLAHHFGVSCQSAIFRLHNLRLIRRPELASLRDQTERGAARELAAFLRLPEPDHQTLRNEFRSRFLGLALEAYRRENITIGKLRELSAMVNAEEQDLQGILEKTQLGESEGPVDVLIPRC